MYLGLYTWNLRTGFLDDAASHTGLEFAGAVLKPGEWIHRNAVDFWANYIYLIDVREQNEQLAAKVKELSFELAQAREEEQELLRLRALNGFSAPAEWERVGARIIAQRLGSEAALSSIMLNKGYLQGAGSNTPVVTHTGVVGRIMRAGPFTATVQLITDPSSRVAVLGRDSRTPGILMGTGPRSELVLRFVPLNAKLEEGEILVTSGLAGAYPKGLPVARIKRIEHSDISLFQTVHATPLANIERLEEVLLLQRPPGRPAMLHQTDTVQEEDSHAEHTNATSPQ
ncbi:rod shape-determining protein MreC [Oleidesulfovibrio sp.]|uniref:rod shape-determining protein MreC n=1 Tax=Oleidesulfovibrio sp. TaxID=2909707 RepID=UPI003A8397C3